MNELIKIEEAVISNEKVNAVDARELHKFLGSRQEFSNWIKARLEKNRFEEGFDFLITLSKNNSQGRPAKEYTVSLEVAKHICMMENTDKGHEVRKYFIECEKALRTLEPELTEEIQQKVLGYNQFLDSSNTYSMAEAAQLLGTGRTRLMKDLRDNRYLKANNTPYQRTVESGYMITKLVPTRVSVITVARVTAKGLAEPLARLQRLALDHLRHKL